MTWSLLVLTVVGNGSHLGMEASHVQPPWWAAALVGAVPPAVAGAVAHLLVLLGRTSDRVIPAEPRGMTEAPAPMSPVKAPTTAPVPAKPTRIAQGSDKYSAETKARALLAEHPTIGRRALAQRTGVSEHVARTLLAEQAQPQVTPSPVDAAATPRNGHAVLQEAK